MSKSIVKEGIEILAAGQDFEALRRVLIMTVAATYMPVPAFPYAVSEDDSVSALSTLLSQLPTEPLATLASITKGRTGIKDAPPGTFPLVVTAEARSNTDHYDFEGPGVMIPMVSSTGHGDASLKRIHYQDGQYAVGSILAVVQPKDGTLFSARYLHAYLSAFKDELLVSRMVGTANVSLTVTKISEVPVPCLPIEGQRKIDELMKDCNRLEAQQADSMVVQKKVVDVLLSALSQSADAADLATNWQRLTKYFDILFNSESSLEALKQAIRQLAISGKLVPQDPSDEPANELLKRITAERKQLEAKGISKKSKLAPLGDEEVYPFELPVGWKWARLGDVGLIGSSSRVHQKDWTENGIPFYRAREIVKLCTEGFVNNDLFISEALYQTLSEGGLAPSAGDLMITGVGTIGIPYIVRQTDRFYFKDASVLIFKNYHGLCPEFLCNFMKSPYWIRRIHEESMGTTVHTLTINRANEVLLPLPPLAEQRRIMAKVDELMALCDRIKSNLRESRCCQERLGSTLIKSSLRAA